MRLEKWTKGPVASPVPSKTPLPTSPEGEETLPLPPWGSAPSPTGEGWGEASPFHFWPFTRRMFKGLLLRIPRVISLLSAPPLGEYSCLRFVCVAIVLFLASLPLPSPASHLGEEGLGVGEGLYSKP